MQDKESEQQHNPHQPVGPPSGHAEQSHPTPPPHESAPAQSPQQPQFAPQQQMPPQYQQQPGQYANAQQPQYIVAQRSLEGIGGWLLFFMILFALAGIGYISAFFGALEVNTGGSERTLLLLFAPILSIVSIASVVFMSLGKKLGKLLALVGIGVSTLYAVLGIIVSTNNAVYTPGAAVTVGSILTALVVGGLFALYFLISKRVKQTLVK